METDKAVSITDLILERAGRRLTRSKTFPKLGDIKVFVKPWTVAERAKAIKWARACGFTGEYEVDVCLMKACDEMGNPLFSPHDRSRLVNFGDPESIGELCDFLTGPELFAAEGEEVERLGEPSPGSPA